MTHTRLTRYIGPFAGLVLFGLFAVIASNVKTGGVLARLDTALNSELDALRQETPTLQTIMSAVTGAGGIRIIFAVVCAGVLWLLRIRRYDLAVVWLAALAGAYLLTAGLKEWFSRPRPPLASAQSWSLPSGHALNSMVGYGFSVYVVCQIGLPRWLRLLFGLTVGLLIVGIGFSRLYLGEHFLTDVLGGWAMASGVLAILMIFTSLWRRPSAAKRSSSNTG